MRRKELIQHLEDLGACNMAIRWVQKKNLPPHKLYKECPYEWMDWLVVTLYGSEHSHSKKTREALERKLYKAYLKAEEKTHKCLTFCEQEVFFHKLVQKWFIKNFPWSKLSKKLRKVSKKNG